MLECWQLVGPLPLEWDSLEVNLLSSTAAKYHCTSVFPCGNLLTMQTFPSYSSYSLCLRLSSNKLFTIKAFSHRLFLGEPSLRYLMKAFFWRTNFLEAQSSVIQDVFLEKQSQYFMSLNIDR